MKTIYLGADHAGFDLKEKIKSWLEKKKISFIDCGNLIFDQDDDYPDFAEKVAKKAVQNKTKGILFCGSAEGMCIAANKVRDARAVAPCNPIAAKRSREHNDANILCLAGGNTLVPMLGFSALQATKTIEIFLKTNFSGEKRHVRRLRKIARMEQN